MLSRTIELEIVFGDCDPAGIVYYPNYFRFFDNATAGLLSSGLGMHKRDWLARFDIVGIPMVDTGARFLRPSRFGDTVTLASHITEIGRSSFKVNHILHNAGEVAVEAHEKRVWTRRDEAGAIRAVPLPDDVRRIFEA